MKRNHLMASVALGLFAAAGAVQAADGWYVAPAIGYYNSDSDRMTERGSVFGALGIGKYFGNNASIEFSIDRTTRNNDFPGQSHWSNLGAGVTYRQFFGDGAFQPYFLVGGGANRHARSGSEAGWDFMAQAGGGLRYGFSQRVHGRAEAFYRYDMDGDSLPNSDNFGDWVVALGLEIALGQVERPYEPAPPPPPPPPPPAEPHCSELDSDGDGVNDCDDRCPGTPAGTVVGPDGCPLQVAVDLRGVEFDFDRSTLRPESVQTLDEATEVLRQYPDIRVEVAGHTDSIGTEQYNQGLSERRAKAVYDYLVGNGIDSGRLTTRGYGELSPIADNATREGRQRNRRTELVVQN